MDRPGLYTVRLTLVFNHNDERRGDGITLRVDDVLKVRTWALSTHMMGQDTAVVVAANQKKLSKETGTQWVPTVCTLLAHERDWNGIGTQRRYNGVVRSWFCVSLAVGSPFTLGRFGSCTPRKFFKPEMRRLGAHPTPIYTIQQIHTIQHPAPPLS